MSTLLFILMFVGGPHNLSTDLLTEPQAVYKGGYHTSATLAQVQEAWRRGQNDYFQVSTIHSEHPRLAWELPEDMTRQRAYHILVASKADLLTEGKADIWDSGDVIALDRKPLGGCPALRHHRHHRGADGRSHTFDAHFMRRQLLIH